MNFTLKIYKRSQPEWLIFFIFILPFAFGCLLDLFRLPNFIKYSLDVSCIFLFFLILLNVKRNKFITKNVRLVILWSSIFILITFIVYIFNYQSILFYILGLRNNFRFFVFLFACIAFLRLEDIKIYLKHLDILFWINAIVCFIQYFIFNYYGDYLGGLFGTERGCNGYTNIFFLLISIKSMLFYLRKKESAWLFILKTVVIIYISAIAELKFFYIEFIILIIIAVCITEFSLRKLLIIVFGFFIVVFGMQLLIQIYSHSSDLFSIESVFTSALSDKGYSSSGDLNRLTAIPVISKQFLGTTFEKLFGLGLGNCDTAGFSFLESTFYSQYSYLHYTWFSSAFMFIETGVFGLIFYFGFFILMFILSKNIAKVSEENKIFAQISSLFALSCMMISFYNSSLRTEAGYLAFFVLSFPFIVEKENIQS